MLMMDALKSAKENTTAVRRCVVVYERDGSYYFLGYWCPTDGRCVCKVVDGELRLIYPTATAEEREFIEATEPPIRRPFA